MKIDYSVISSFQLVATQIEELRFKNDFLELPAEIAMSTSCEYEKTVFPSEDYRSGTVSLTVRCQGRVKGDKRKLSFLITIAGAFCDNINISEEEFSKKLDINGCASLYSIARAQTLNLCSNAFADNRIILPLINFYRLKQKEQP